MAIRCIARNHTVLCYTVPTVLVVNEGIPIEQCRYTKDYYTSQHLQIDAGHGRCVKQRPLSDQQLQLSLGQRVGKALCSKRTTTPTTTQLGPLSSCHPRGPRRLL